jgi:hypothetical protein
MASSDTQNWANGQEEKKPAGVEMGRSGPRVDNWEGKRTLLEEDQEIDDCY